MKKFVAAVLAALTIMGTAAVASAERDNAGGIGTASFRISR